MRKSSRQVKVLGFFLCLVLYSGSSVHAQINAGGQGGIAIDTIPHDQRKGLKQPLLDVLIGLNKSRGVYFLFSQQPLGRMPVNPPIDQPDLPVEKVLTQVLKNTGLYYKKVDDKTFVILSRKDLHRSNSYDSSGNLQAASITDQDQDASDPESNIAGRVMAMDGKALQGVSITIKGTRKGVTTDLDGVFDIYAHKEDILVFSFVGYKVREMPVGEAMSKGVTLEPSTQPLEEVVITALGIGRQEKTLGYSASEMDGALFTQSRAVNLGNALIGQVAGVSVAENATGPYGSSRVLIRGNASLSGNNQPLYVVDGIPYDNASQGYAGQWGGLDLGDGLSNISPDNIASILVLKGVSASALYGYRGGNGAILITTKSGSRTKGLGVQLNNNCAINSAIDQRDFQYVYGQGVSGVKPTTTQMALNAPYYSWGAKMDGSPAVNFLGNAYAYSPARNSFRNFYRTGITNQTSLALTGANNKGHFRLGLSNLYLNTVIPNSDMRQQGINFNATYSVTSRLQMDLTADYVFEQVHNRASLSDNAGNLIAPTLYLANSFDIRWLKRNIVNPDGTELLPGTTDPYFENPYYIACEYRNMTDRNRLTGGLTLKYHLLDWLFVQGQVMRDGYIFDVTNIVPSGVLYTRSDGIHGGNMTQYEVNYHEVNGSFMIGAHSRAGRSFSFSGNLGGNRQDNVNNISGIGAVPYSSNRPAGPFIIAGLYNPNNIVLKPYSNYYRHYRVNSLYGSADLSYRNYLFLNLTARNDWFSTLNINTDHYLYPSASAGFVFTEAFHLPAWISLGKLRASYAGSSNGTEPYQTALTYGLQGYTVNGQPLGYIATNYLIPNGSLRPVSIAEKEAGILLQFFHNRAGIDFTWYDKRTTNDIVTVTVSQTSGYNQYIENIGKIRNRGIELLLTATPVKSRDFSWNFSFNYAVNDNKVLSIGVVKGIVIQDAYPRWGSEVSISNIVGLPYGQIVGYTYKRDSKGNIVFSDGISNPAPAGEPEQTGVVPLGSTVYRQAGALTNELHYRNFSLSWLIDFKFGAKLYSGTNLLLYYYGLHKNTLQGREGGYIGKGVLENGHSNGISVPSQQYFQDISASGTDHIAEEFVYDAGFIKFRSFSLGYGFPIPVRMKKLIKSVNLSLVGRNLAILLKHTPNIDPESSINNTNGQGLEQSGFPPTRSWGINLNVKF